MPSGFRSKSPEELMIEKEQGFDEGIARTRRVVESKPRRQDSGSGLYFVGAAGANLVKIGWVRRLSKVDQRVSRLQTDCPYPAVLLFTIGPATQLHESRVHKRFIAQHWHGEWFKNEGDLAEFLCLLRIDEERAHNDLRKVMDLTF